MARAQVSDFLHSMRFHVTTQGTAQSAVEGGDYLGKNTGTNTPAGFMSCTTPEATTEAVEYREGMYNYPRKFPGNTTVSDCSLQKGVARNDSSFWFWLSTVIHGGGDYRVEMKIAHYDRTALSEANKAQFDVTNAKAARTYVLHEAFPIRHKVAADLDASTSDISVMELDVAYEYFDVIEEPIPTT